MRRAIVICCVLAVGLTLAVGAQILSGSWETTLSIDPQQASFADAISLDSELIVNYVIGDWSFTSESELDEDGWDWQQFYAAGVLGAFTFGSTLDIDPDTPAFIEWEVETTVSIAGVSFGAVFNLYDLDTRLELTASGTAGDVALEVELTLGGDDNDECDFSFNTIDIEFGFPFCCADISGVLSFDCGGFTRFCIGVADGIAVPNLPWFTLGAALCYRLDEKTIELNGQFDFGETDCFNLHFEVEKTGVLTIENISIVGIELICDIGAITFHGRSELGGAGGNLVDSPYWEAYTISTSDDACCGPFSFDMSVYFLEGGVRLFDIGLFEANMELQVASQFTFTTGLEINAESGAFTEWTLGFVVTW